MMHLRSNTMPRRMGKYGLDAPYFIPLPSIAIAWYVAQGVISRRPGPFIGATLMALCMAFGLYSSLRGKFVVWAELLDELKLRGDERILDIGCGRGAVLLLAARYLTTGRAVGVDLWSRSDQSGNAIDATRRNAVAEGVAGRVELHTGNMTVLPFENDSFDLVVSNIAIHNVSGGANRNKAIAEAARVLRPGGRLMIADLRFTGDYVAALAQLGLCDITRRNLGWRMWWSGPWAATRLVTARKRPLE